MRDAMLPTKLLEEYEAEFIRGIENMKLNSPPNEKEIQEKIQAAFEVEPPDLG